MFQYLKKVFYFPIASYFRFFAKIKLTRWSPRVVVVTGSSGKTTLFELIKAQLGDLAYYSDHANSSFGIPFNILGLERENLFLSEWFGLFFSAPIKIISKIPKQKIYVVEADCDRPGEGVFLSTLLKPEVTIWLSSSRTHSMNFDSLVEQKMFENVEEAIAYEYGYFLEKTSKLAIINSDNELITKQLVRTKAGKIGLSKKTLHKYEVSKEGTGFKINSQTYKFRYLLPEAVFSSISAALKLSEYLGTPIDNKFSEFEVPPGRSGIFKGIKNTTLIDSSYNTGFEAYSEIFNMFNKIYANKKWVVLGDILEQGKQEKEEHEKLAELIIKFNFDRVILLGPRIYKHGFETLQKHYKDNIVHFNSPKDILNYLLTNISDGETILFKGARFLEGVIENMLADKSEAPKLSRREKVWEIRRKKWGL